MCWKNVSHWKCSEVKSSKSFFFSALCLLSVGNIFEGLGEESEILKDIWYLFNSPCLMTLPFLIVFFADKCVNSPKTFSVGFLWGEDLPGRGDDDELVLIFSEVVFVRLVARCQLLVSVSGAQYCMWFWLPTIWSVSQIIVFACTKNHSRQSRREPRIHFELEIKF